MAKTGTLLNEYELVITEDSLNYKIEYLLKPKDLLKNILRSRGGGEFRITKLDCKIVDTKIYQ